MKYSNEIGINLPVNRVVELFDNPENLKLWQPGLISFEHLSGEPGQVGAKSRLKYKMGKREIEMIETITSRNLPYEFAGTYEAKGVRNTVCNKFVPLSENRTRLISESEFKFRGFMRIIGLLMPGSFRKQSQKFLEDFKAFAERSSAKS
jgi:hypothetical protein